MANIYNEHISNYPMPSSTPIELGALYADPTEALYYIYFYHTGDYIILPTYPEQISDSTAVTYSAELPLGRSAPLQSYGGSGPRVLQFLFVLHRDMMTQINYNNTSIDGITADNDYIDEMAKKIQGAALPEYAVSDKMVNPPMVSVKIGNEVFIKGVVTGSVGVNYKPPILRSGYYANVDIQFTVTEVIPYSASDVMKMGSYREYGYSLLTSEVYLPGRTVKNSGSSKITEGNAGTKSKVTAPEGGWIENTNANAQPWISADWGSTTNNNLLILTNANALPWSDPNWNPASSEKIVAVNPSALPWAVNTSNVNALPYTSLSYQPKTKATSSNPAAMPWTDPNWGK